MRKLKTLWDLKHRPAVLASAAIIVGIIAVVVSVSNLMQGPRAAEPPNATEWLSAISTFWGAIATAIGAVVTAGALLIAAQTYRRQVADKHQDLLNQHRAQAVSVTLGSRTEKKNEDRVKRASISISDHVPPEPETHIYFVRNNSPLAIYKVELIIGESDVRSTDCQVLAPGDEIACESLYSPVPGFARFTDSSGVAWRRDISGHLMEIDGDYHTFSW